MIKLSSNRDSTNSPSSVQANYSPQGTSSSGAASSEATVPTKHIPAQWEKFENLAFLVSQRLQGHNLHSDSILARLQSWLRERSSFRSSQRSLSTQSSWRCLRLLTVSTSRTYRHSTSLSRPCPRVTSKRETASTSS
ncbi:hypothetical protein FGO68_gene12415 [Halteria grandinella]|uniref:Uncharacterized protein n=1 Tax=Halteria grandinella TaxID=5974 RepID=A0A8J8SWG4_HALGN|nr:hypothetical protein FGO68_gene12415 [Halteria grandinella]